MQKHLILFFTKDTGLRDWESVGLLDRELQYYRRLIKEGFRVTFVTYDGRGGKEYRTRIAPINLIFNRFGFSKKAYIWWLINRHGRVVKRRSIVKTNQIVGGGIAKNFARVGKIPFIVRAGHLPSDTAKWRYGEETQKARKVTAREKRIIESADQVMVTTSFMMSTIMENYNVEPWRIMVVPNYIDTSIFRPIDQSVPRKPLAGFIGRLESKKNVVALVESFSGLNIDLEIIGAGSLRGELVELARLKNIELRLRDPIPNHQLPLIYNRFSIYVQPSHLEHHPKTLLEAMACGLPVVASNRKGIRELIEDGKTGILCETEPESIREAVRWVIENPREARQLGAAAREFVVRNFNIDTVVNLEKMILDTTFR
jgi:glycosyltransferase involved in cell wall biosynthesis